MSLFLGNRSRYLSFLILIISVASTPYEGFSSEGQRQVKSLREIRLSNVILQQWELSCAAAALATLLRYQHGEPVTERIVAIGLISRRDYIANPDLVRIRQGFSLLDMKRYVETLGYEGVGLGSMTLEDLYLRAPVIVPVNLQGFPHFVIFRGGTHNKVLLADPAFGNVTMSANKFIKSWIRYKDIGRVGFFTMKDGTLLPAGVLAASALDFVMLN